MSAKCNNGLIGAQAIHCPVKYECKCLEDCCAPNKLCWIVLFGFHFTECVMGPYLMWSLDFPHYCSLPFYFLNMFIS